MDIPNDRPNSPNALLNQVRQAIRLKHLSLRTEEAYLSTIRRFILFHGKRHPAELGPVEVRAYLTHLAIEGHVAAHPERRPQRPPVPLPGGPGVDLPASTASLLPGVPNASPSSSPAPRSGSLLDRLEGTHHLMACLLYGAGLRLMECVRLRVKDVDFDHVPDHRPRRQRGQRTASPCSPSP